MTIRKIHFVVCVMCLLMLPSSGLVASAQTHRQRISLDDSWTFHLGDEVEFASSDYDDSQWRVLNVPHDWAIESDFSQEAPAGPNGGALPGGIGWYRKRIVLDMHDLTQQLYLLFDGVYMQASVYVNGQYVGGRPNGYLPIYIDISEVAQLGENVVAVRVDNEHQPNSRWYSGCGIYRHVWLIKKPSVQIDYDGVYVRSIPAADHADITIQTTLNNAGDLRHAAILNQQVISPTGHVVNSTPLMVNLEQNAQQEIIQEIRLEGTPHRWDIEHPNLYTLRTSLSSGDTLTTRFGIRSYHFDAQQGFFLNGRHVMLKGVCMHHDLGCLGSAIDTQAMLRQLTILKEMGCNAIRCAHNPPAPSWLNLCDSMGFVVMNESFDMWRRRKTTYDYSTHFEAWYVRDLHDMMLRDRNHPAIMMWSIGNEVLEQWNDISTDTLSLEAANLILNAQKDASQLGDVHDSLSFNARLTQTLAALVKRDVPDALVTAGCNEPRPANHLFRSQALDIIGYNYHEQYLDSISSFFPGKPFLFSEATSALMTRGYYEMPSDSARLWPTRWDVPFSSSETKCSAYDNCRTPWGNSHEGAWLAVKDNPFVAGLFVWTGFDYLGEPTPFSWPARSSYFGIVDLAGFPKDVYYMYQSEWTDKPVLHLFPHWNWTAGQTVDMWAYYNHADEVELYINGLSQGIRRKTNECLHAMWRVTFEPGTVTCVSRNHGKEVMRVSHQTTGRPVTLVAKADQTSVDAGGNLVFITVEAKDQAGRIVPTAQNKISCQVTGQARFVGMDNGCQTGHTSLQTPHSRLFNGKCLIVVRSTKQAGEAMIKIFGEHLKEIDLSLLINE